MTTIYGTLLCLYFALAPCSSHGPSTPESTRDSDGIPFQTLSGFLIVFQGRIGNFNGLRFVLDTGATHSAVNTKVAQKMGVPLRGAALYDFDRFVSLHSGQFPDIEFGPVHVTDVSLIVADLSQLSGFNSGVDAIIGSDLLSLSNFSIRYDTQKIFFSPVKTSGLLAKPRPAAMIIQLQLQGQPLNLLVDTGIECVVLFEDRLRGRIPRARALQEASDVTVGQRLHGKLAVLSDVRLGPRTMELKVILIRGPKGGVLPGIDGYWSAASLKARRIDFDFAKNRLSWQE